MIRLSKISTVPSKKFNKEKCKAKLDELRAEIKDLQTDLFAENKQSLLVVFQGMDASGKDGSTRSTFKECSPLGVRAFGFGKPTEAEFEQDFIWRAHKIAPPKGMIHVFNRSHYEDILIQRVHKWIDEKTVDFRMDAINHFEELLTKEANTRVLKFYLHISRKNQVYKLNQRIIQAEDNWKHNPNDKEEAKLWDDYMECYEFALNQSDIPWNIVPADKKWYRNYFIAKTVRDTLLDMKIKRPVLEQQK